MSLIMIRDLKKKFQGKEVIKGINFQLNEGKCTALIGPNGSGKTTILRMLSGIMRPTEGTISFTAAKKGEDIRNLIGYLPQFPVFYNWMSGREFLEYVGKLAGLNKTEAKNRSKELLEIAGISEHQNQRIGKYSGGMRQRLGIAQAIIHSPKLLLLDEPVSALDPFGRREVLELLEEMKKDRTILFSTHILNDAEEVSDEILFLHNGKIVESGTMDELRKRHQQLRIDLTFQDKAEAYAPFFTSSGLTESAKIEGNRISLFVYDIEKARNHFLKEITDKKYPLVKFEISGMTLEDVFMKVVGS